MEFSATKSAAPSRSSRLKNASATGAQETSGETEFAVTLDAILAAPSRPAAKARLVDPPENSGDSSEPELQKGSEEPDASVSESVNGPDTVLAQALTFFQAAATAAQAAPAIKSDTLSATTPQSIVIDLPAGMPGQTVLEKASTQDPLTVSPDNTVQLTVAAEVSDQTIPTLATELTENTAAIAAGEQPTLSEPERLRVAATPVTVELNSVPQSPTKTEVSQQVSVGTAPEAQSPMMNAVVLADEQIGISKPAAPAAPAGHRLQAAALEGVQATAVRPETTGSTDRSAATQRPTMTLTMREVSVISAFGGEALEGEAAGSKSSSEEFGQDWKQAGGASSSNASGSERGGLAASAPSEFSKELKTAAITPVPLDVEERVRIVEQVRRKIDALHLTNGRHEATLRLNPEHLGEVRLSILSERNQVTAQFMAETAQARQAMTEGREQLRSALEQKGFTLQSLEVGSLKPGDGDGGRSALPQMMQNFNLSANSGGDRRSGTSSSGRRAANQTSDTDLAVESIPPLTESTHTRRPNGRLDYRV
jgi:flagellar hook-length control protein FliK